jgi:outer membrane autotransporter protein
MNTSHRSLWNSSLGAWVAVSEITRAGGKRSSGAAVALVLLGASVCSSVGAQNRVIDGGASETVPGTQSSPWTMTGSLTVGNAGTGVLTVSNGGMVSSSVGYLGWLAGANGTVTVSGVGSTWGMASMIVGENGTGTLTVQGGGAVSSSNSSVGGSSGGSGTVTVTGTGSRWTNSADLSVGQLDTGTLTVSNGGTVSNANGFLGSLSNGAGTAMVTGTGSTWTNLNLMVGRVGTGTLTVANGGLVSLNSGAGVLDVAFFAGSTGVVNIGAAPAGAAQAAGTVVAGEVRFGAGTGSLNFNHTDPAYTFSTRITGSGVLNHYAGTTVLTGANTYSGGTTVSGGVLQGNSTSLQGAITNNAAVSFNQATTGTYAGAMTGIGSLTKMGAGNLVLTGVNTYNGATSVNAGTLSVNGSISNSAVTVNNGGVLGGSGTVGSTTIASGGVLAPGNSIGTLTVNGNLSFAAGSIYRVEVDAAGANDRINATGTAALNGTVDVQAGAGTYQASTQYTILNAAGGRTGNFAGVTSNLAFLTPTLGYDANNVFLTLARNEVSFASVAITPNQIATSTALQNAGNTGDMGAVQTALTGLSATQARAAYDSASGSGIVALRRAGSGFAAGFGSQLQARLGAQANAASGFANSFASRPVLLAANDHLSDLMAPVSDSAPQKFSLAGGASSLSSSPDAAGKGLWVRGYGGYGSTDSDGNAAGSKLRSSGLSVGFDAEVKDGVRIGIAATGGTSRLSTDNNESGKTRGTAVAVYGSYAAGPWNFSGSASMGWGKNHMDRSVTVGAVNRVAASDFDSNTLAAYGEASYAIAMNGWTLQPLAGLSLSKNKADGFTETGAGALNLQVAGQTIKSSKSLLGAKASFDAGRVRVEPRVIWAHEFGDLNTPMTAQFQGAATASPFQISGAALKRDSLTLGLGAAGSISKGIDLFADLQAEFNAAQRNVALLVGLRSRW